MNVRKRTLWETHWLCNRALATAQVAAFNMMQYLLANALVHSRLVKFTTLRLIIAAPSSIEVSVRLKELVCGLSQQHIALWLVPTVTCVMSCRDCRD